MHEHDYMTLVKKQNYRDRKKISSYQRLCTIESLRESTVYFLMYWNYFV